VARMGRLIGMNVLPDVRTWRWSVEEDVRVMVEIQRKRLSRIQNPQQLHQRPADVHDGKDKFVGRMARPTSMIARPGVQMLTLSVMVGVHVGDQEIMNQTCSQTTESLFLICGMLSWLTFSPCRVEVKHSYCSEFYSICNISCLKSE